MENFFKGSQTRVAARKVRNYDSIGRGRGRVAVSSIFIRSGMVFALKYARINRYRQNKRNALQRDSNFKTTMALDPKTAD